MPIEKKFVSAVGMLGIALVVGCGGSESGSRIVRQGVCEAPVGGAGTVIPIWSKETQCEGSGGVLVIQSTDEYDAACSPIYRRDTLGLDLPTIDFSTEQLLLVGGGDSGVHFLVDDGVTLHLGLLAMARGFPLPGAALAIPRTDHPLAVHSCAEVCEGDCPPIP